MSTSLTLHCLQHDPGKGPALLETWAKQNNHTLSVTRLHQGEPLPSFNAFDLLIVLGGEMSADDESKFSWLKEEKSFLKASLQADKRLLGIGLGAQLIAEVMGGKVTRGKFWEVGWHEVEWTEAAKEHPYFAGLPPRFRPFQWHHDEFTLPPNALLTATSTIYPNQGFLIGQNVVGLQFHPEVTEESLLPWVGANHSELPKESFVQRIDEILHQADRLERAKQFLFTFLDRFTQRT